MKMSFHPTTPARGRPAWLAYAVAGAVLFHAAASQAKPRPPGIPWPEVGIISHLTFDAPIRAPTNEVVDSNLYAESWTGYALRRGGSYVQPFTVPMVASNSVFKIDPERGAIRLFFRPDWSSLSTGLGAGPGNAASLLALATTNGASGAVWWSLGFSADGNAAQLVCQGETSPTVCMSAPVSLQAGSWHLFCLGYSETNCALFIDGQEVATGNGLPPVPTNAAPFTSLVLGSSLTSGEVVSGQIDEVSIFTGNKRLHQELGQPFGLSPGWEITSYYNRLSPVAAKGPITDAELAAAAAALAERAAAAQATATLSASALARRASIIFL